MISLRSKRISWIIAALVAGFLLPLLLLLRSYDKFSTKYLDIMKNQSTSQLYEDIPSMRGIKAEALSEESFLTMPEQCDMEIYSIKDPLEDDFEFLKTEKGKEFKTILSFYNPYVSKFYYGYGWKPFAKCLKESRCFITARKDILPVSKFDAVLIHFGKAFTYDKLPKERSPNQRWIFVEMEPPTKSSEHPEYFNGIFNWTMTYRKDSDIPSLYGSVYPKSICPGQKHFNKLLSNVSSLELFVQSKTKLVAWVASSNCNGFSKRKEYIEKLQKHIPVDIYGKCGHLKCYEIRERNKCYDYLEGKYKFYLAFENSFCKDYISEKFFNILGYYIVPVVRGAGDYVAVAPPHSYIDAKDFKSEKELAKYLKFLDKNQTAYMEYFKWKEDYFVRNEYTGIASLNRFCTLCRKLHENSKKKTYWDLKDWFTEQAKC